MRIATMLVFRSRAFSWRAHAQCSAKRPPYCARRPQRARRYADKPQLARSADLHHADYAGNLVSRRQTTQRNQLVFTVPTPRSSQAYCTPLPQELQPGAKMNPEVFENCSAILIDIAGTVGSINFTKDTLYAFAKKNIEEYLTSKWDDEEVKKLVAELKGDGEELADVTKAVERFNTLTDENSVNVGLKTMQGLLYKQGYEKGELKAHVFDDIKSALEEWSKHRKICIYSTGAEEAQKQYFSHSTAGDLSAFIANYFDQTVGKKTASESYEGIAKTLEVKPAEILYLSDDIDEIKAATKAGCASVLVTREGNAEISEDDKKDRLVVSSFADLPLSGKRKSEEDVSTEEPPKKVAKLEEETKIEEAKEATETMEVDSSEAAAAIDTNESAAKTELAVETAEIETPKESSDSVVKTDCTDSPKVESTEATAADTTDKTIPPEKAEEAATTADAPVEKMDDTPTPASTTTEVTEQKTEEVDAVKTETETVPDKVADVTVASEAKPTEEKPAEPESTPETKTLEETPEVKQNGKENGKEKAEEAPKVDKVEENGKANGDAATEEKENKRDIANGTAEVSDVEKENKVEEEVKMPTEEVKAKKIEEATESTPLTVEA